MANDINKVMLIGRLTRDPEFKTINNYSLTHITLACGRSYTANNGEKKEETLFIDCETWGKPAEILQQYMKKGKQIAIEGRLKQDTWDTADGKKASKIKVVIENFQFLGSKTDNTDGQQHGQLKEEGFQAPLQTIPDSAHFVDDDIPF